jgi:tellurite resistance protein TerC
MGFGLDTIGSPELWIGFVAFVLVMLALDLGVFHRRAHSVSFKEAAIWSAIWIGLALVAGAGIWFHFGQERGIEFLTGYFIEKSLSIDNLFVFVVIFSAMGVPAVHQHRVLLWGILGALVMRAAMIFAGVAMIARFHWVIYVFGAFLVVTGVRLFVHRKEEVDPESSKVTRFVRRLIPSTSRLDGAHFFTRVDGRLLATPLLTTLVLIEISDVVFAVDSIPAVFAITTDPFIVFTSNIFAILGLRALFFLVAGLLEKFAYLKVGLAGVLIFVGVKMTIADFVHVPPAYSLAVVTLILGASGVASVIKARRAKRAATTAEAEAEE